MCLNFFSNHRRRGTYIHNLVQSGETCLSLDTILCKRQNTHDFVKREYIHALIEENTRHDFVKKEFKRI